VRFPSLAWTLVVAVGLAGCRSAAPAAAPMVPDPAPAAAAPEPTSDLAPPPDEAPPEPVAEALPADPLPGEEAPAEAGDPHAVQREALEMCEQAEAAFERGEIEEAVAALDRAYELMLELPGDGEDEFVQAKEDVRLLVAGLVTRIYQAGRTPPAAPRTSWDLALPIVSNDHVQREIRSMTTVERDQFLDGYRRSGRYRPMILAKLAEAGLPAQLSWLPLVESWFKVRALSRASALGMWQFISSTGMRYGLRRDAWVDERFDPEKSTDAAIAYLVELHALFGDWPKALAGYNCGEARVHRLQRRSEEYLDFWDLYEMLPRETRRYVPRLFAALQIIEDPAKYGVTLPEPDPADGDTTTVRVERAVKLQELAGAVALDAGALAELNPELRHRATPQRAYDLRVPTGYEEAVLAKLESVPVWKRPVVEYTTHRVRSGETLSVIARRYGSSVSAIMRANGLRSANRIWPGQRLRIPSRGAPVVRTVSQTGGDHGLRRYRVSRGDTLGAIAAAHGVSLSALLHANGLTTRSTIHPGQSLVVP